MAVFPGIGTAMVAAMLPPPIKSKKNSPESWTTLYFKCGIVYDIMTLLLTLSSGKGVTAMQNLLDFILSIIASVIAYYICKWLDGNE